MIKGVMSSGAPDNVALAGVLPQMPDTPSTGSASVKVFHTAHGNQAGVYGATG